MQSQPASWRRAAASCQLAAELPESLHTYPSHSFCSSCCIPVGYNTWDDFRCGGINNTNVMKVADAIVRYGLDKVGYEYLGLDDCWATSRDEQTGVIVPDPKAFPDGMKAVADYVHKKGLKFGICTLPHAVWLSASLALSAH